MVFNPLEPIRDIFKVMEYVSTDQEKEGRELGIKAASRIYQPVLRNLESRQTKILAATDKEQSFFEGQAKSLRDQCAEYEQKTADLAERIKNSSEKKSESVDNFFRTINSFGMYSVQSVSIIGGNIYDSWSLSDYLEKKMKEKREKFYNIEFKNKNGHYSHSPLNSSFELYPLSIDEQFFLFKKVVREEYKADQNSQENEEFIIPIILEYSSNLLAEFKKLTFSFYLSVLLECYESNFVYNWLKLF